MSLSDEAIEQLEARSMPELTPERRRKPRILQPFLVQVSGRDTEGAAFETGAVLDNMSTIGLYLKLNRKVEPGIKLKTVIRLSTSGVEDFDVAKIAAETVVVRSEPLPDGRWGLALAIVKRRFV
jgi:hypothetical protein